MYLFMLTLFVGILTFFNYFLFIKSETNYVLGGPNGNIRVVLINLDRRTDRLKNCEKQLHHYGLNYTRFSALDAHAVKKRLYDQIPPLHPKLKFGLKGYMGNPTNCQEGCGWLGCFISHVSAHLVMYEELMKGPDGPVLFLEDDIRIEENALDVINRAINTLPDSWELLAVGYKNDYCAGNAPHTTSDGPPGKMWCRARLFLDTHAYIIRNATAMAHYLEYENKPQPEAIDLLWVPLMEFWKVEPYLLKPKVIFQNREFISDVTPNVTASSRRNL